MRARLKPLLFVCSCAGSLLLFCVNSPSSSTDGGGGIETIALTGVLYTADSIPAKETEVILLNTSFNPGTNEPITPQTKDTTDSNGNYTLNSSDTGLFNIIATHLHTGQRLCIPQINLTNQDLYLQPDTLQVPGTISIVFTKRMDIEQGYIFIPGTDMLTWLSESKAINDTTWVAVINSVPPDVSYSLLYAQTDAPQSLLTIGEYVILEPGQNSTVFTNDSLRLSRLVYLNTTNTGADITEQLLNFPVLLRLTSVDIPFEEFHGQGLDLRIFKPDDSPVPFQIEHWDSAAGTAFIWALLDTVYANSDWHAMTLKWAIYSSVDVSNSQEVFSSDNGFAGVWHCDSSAPGIANNNVYTDASGNNNHGTDFISSDSSALWIGPGQNLNGIDDYIILPDSQSLAVDTFTSSFWVNFKETGREQMILDWAQNWGTVSESNDGWAVFLHSNGGIYFTGAGESGTLDSINCFIPSSNIIAGEWYHISCTFDEQYARMYLNGIEAASYPAAFPLKVGTGFQRRIGAQTKVINAELRHLNGLLDEIRISRTVRSSNWIRCCYENQRPNQILVRYE